MEIKRWIPALFLAICVVQLAVPAKMIVDREVTLSRGEAFRFKTAPVDPYDFFRGRYVRLQLEAATVSGSDTGHFEHKDRAYAIIEEGADGFARFSSLEVERPGQGAYLRVRVGYHDGYKLHLELPFDRYYMEESLAPEAERAYRQHSRQAAADAFITVRVLNGRGVLEELYIGGKPVLEFLADEGP